MHLKRAGVTVSFAQFTAEAIGYRPLRTPAAVGGTSGVDCRNERFGAEWLKPCVQRELNVFEHNSEFFLIHELNKIHIIDASDFTCKIVSIEFLQSRGGVGFVRRDFLQVAEVDA